MTGNGYVLIAEPDVGLLNVLVKIVRAFKLETVPTRDGASALATMTERGAPALLITNLVLARVDGFSLLAQLRRLAEANEAAAVVISSSLEMRARAYDLRESLGVSEIVSSTMTASSLHSTIRRVLEGAGLLVEPTPLKLRLAPQSTPGQAPPSTPGAAPPSTPGPTPPSPRPDEVIPRFRDPQRLARVARLGLVDDGPPDESLQHLVEETARTFGVPIALLTLVLEDRQWFKAHVGLGGELLQNRGTPISQSFCRHVVDSETISPLIVPDATTHPVFADNPLVVSGQVGSYAGAPLMTAAGDVLGTLCIIDSKPLGIDQEQVDILAALARRVAGEIELQSRSRAAAELAVELARKLENERSRSQSIAAVVSSYGAVLSNLEIGILLMDEERRILYANPALAKMVGLGQVDLIAMSGRELRAHIASLAEDGDDVQRRMHVLPSGPFVARAELRLSKPTWRVIRWESKPIELAGAGAQLEVFTDITGRMNTVNLQAQQG